MSCMTIMLNSIGRSGALSEQLFCFIWSKHISMADREQPNSLPMADREHHRSEGRSEDEEKLLPQNRRVQPELAGRIFLSRDVVATCFLSTLLFKPPCDCFGKCEQCPQRENRCCTPTQAPQARNQAAMSSALTTNGCTWR